MQLENIHIKSFETLTTPDKLKERFPLSDKASATVEESRQTIYNILDGKDPRLLVVVGPCSIHDVDAAMDYANKLKALSDKVSDSLFIVMRVYFEKPRTTVGWKGLINDPNLDGSFAIEQGLETGRKLMIDINELGLPVANEALDPITPQYLQELVSWSAIGARTTESQTHREMASGLSVAIGFKNGTDGSLDVAFNALQSVSNPHSFLGINNEGEVSIIHTSGNKYGHIVLRGGGGKPNYDSVNIALTEQALEKNKLAKNIMVDCSHANSQKDPAVQLLVLNDITQQILEGNKSIMGLMVESNLGWGNQKLNGNREELEYGVSITDACIDWENTEKSLIEMNEKLKQVLPERRS